MNRIILIGNGFDLAHGLKTGYKDFIDSYWSNILSVRDSYLERLESFDASILKPYEDDFIRFQIEETNSPAANKPDMSFKSPSSYSKLCPSINELNNNKNPQFSVGLKFKNKFFEDISIQCSLTNWVDIENEYYEALKKLLIMDDAKERSNSVKKLNEEFCAVKKLLEKYLTEVSKSVIEAKESIIDVV